MSVRLFHRDARVVLAFGAHDGVHTWRALHRGALDWGAILAPPLRLLGFDPEPGGDRLVFGGGSLDWTTGPLWTTIRLRLPACSEKKAGLLAAGLLKAARYAAGPLSPADKENAHAQRQ